MAERTLPSWARDPLSTFLSDAERNERLSSLKFPNIYGLLQRVHSAFQSSTAIIENDRHEELLPVRFLMARTHAAFLAAIRLGMSGQVVEAHPALRAVIEDIWYALHLAKDPNPPSRAMIWLRRNDNQAAKTQCKNEFFVANVRATHAALDPTTATALQALYEWTIERGAHPNPQGVLAAMSRTEAGQHLTYDVAILTDNPTLVVATLKTAVEVAVCALKIFRLIFPERFTIMGLDAEIETLIEFLNTVFKPYVPVAPPSRGESDLY